jgi:tetratricopeptide (TPR) repeat protein
LAEAEALYVEATKNNPASASAWYGLGRVKAAQQDTNAAINSFERAITLSPQFGAAYYALAMALRDAGRMGKAKEHLALYQQNRLVRPRADDALLDEIAALNYAQFHLNKGIALEAEGDLKNSIAEHEKVLAINPTHIQAHVNLIQLYSRTNQAEKAEQHYRQAVTINPNFADAHYNFGVLLASQGKRAEATDAFTRALTINPNFAEAQYNLGLLLLHATKLDEAMQHFQAAIESKPAYRQAHFELGRILVNKGQMEEAIQHFQQTLTPEDQETPRYLYALAATYVRAGNREKGLEYMRRAKDKAISWEQKNLLAAIERDLKIIEQNR